MAERPQLGQRVKVRAKLERVGLNPDRFGHNATKFKWQRVEFLPSPVEAVYIGFRIVYDGVIRKDDFGGYGPVYTWYEKTRSVKTYLVVLNERTNPIRVLPEDVEVIND